MSAPVEIAVADSQPAGQPSNLPLSEFERQVESLSDGAISVSIRTDAADPRNSDAAIIEGVQDGTFQMAVVPARAWSGAGVTSLKALQAPFLMESERHVTAVVNDAAISDQALAGFEAAGVVGLTLFPESLRHFFSFSDPILRPEDVKGRQVRAITSLETTALIEALGGTAVDPDGDTFTQGVADGTITAAESSFSIALGSTPRPGIATGNLVLYPKILTLVVNGPFWAGLDDAQREVLRTAAAATRAWAIANVTPEVEAAAAYCADGGSVVLTDQAAIEAFRAAEAPVYAQLETDPTTKALIAAIRAITPAGAAGPAACEPPEGSATAPPASAAPAAELPDAFELVATFDTASSELDVPAGLAVGPDGNLYVANAGSDEIVVLDLDGKLLRRWGGHGSGPGEFDFQRHGGNDNTGGVAVDRQGFVYVTDYVNNRVQKFTEDGDIRQPMGQFRRWRRRVPGPLRHRGRARTANVYVRDEPRDDLQEFTSDGKFVRVVAKHGTGLDDLNGAGKVGVGPDGTVSRPLTTETASLRGTRTGTSSGRSGSAAGHRATSSNRPTPRPMRPATSRSSSGGTACRCSTRPTSPSRPGRCRLRATRSRSSRSTPMAWHT